MEEIAKGIPPYPRGVTCGWIDGWIYRYTNIIL